MNKIAIHSVPRSGSSWLGEIINSSPDVNYAFQPLFSYEFKSRLDENSSLTDINKFYQGFSQSEDEFIRQSADRLSGKKPLFRKNNEFTALAYKEVRYHYILENLLKKDPKQKVIGLVRHPLAVLSSWKNAPREFRSDLGWDFDKEWNFANLKNKGKNEEYFGYQKWKETSLMFKKIELQYPENFLLINYSQLLSNIEVSLDIIFKFLDLELGEQTRQFIETTHYEPVNNTYSVFQKKGKIDNVSPLNISTEISKSIIVDCHNSGLSEFLD
tara:strand:+ start:1050 stop:1862 length:813 start_codon:yes stop_codon:yes gene_type:complete